MKNDKKHKILCVDDESSILRSIRRSFFDEDMVISVANSGDGALEYLGKNEVDLVISDYLMPSMTGWELLERIKKLYPAVIRIMLSGYVEKEVILKSLLNYTGVTFFAKPWEDEELKGRIKELLRLKDSITSEDFWIAVNNGFPLTVPILNKDSTWMGETVFKKGNLPEFIKRDIIFYLKLLHLGNSDYMDGKGISSLSDLADIPGIKYLEEVCVAWSVLQSPFEQYLHLFMDKVVGIYPELYTLLFTEPPPDLPDYVSFIVLDRLMYASIFPHYTINKLKQLRDTGDYFSIDKDPGFLVKYIVKLWHLPEGLFTFYKSFHAVTADDVCLTPGEKQRQTLLFAGFLADKVLFGLQTDEVPAWWPIDYTAFATIIGKMKDFTR